MKTTTRVSGHSRGTLVVRTAMAFLFALLLAGSIAHQAAAVDNGPAMDKGAFKTGCEEGGGSYIENNDGSFQCNLKSGGGIKCTSTTGPCTYSPYRVGGGNRGHFQVVTEAKVLEMMQPSPTATPYPGTVLNASASKVFASSKVVLMESTATP